MFLISEVPLYCHCIVYGGAEAYGVLRYSGIPLPVPQSGAPSTCLGPSGRANLMSLLQLWRGKERGYRGTSLMRTPPPPEDHRRSLGIDCRVLGGGWFL